MAISVVSFDQRTGEVVLASTAEKYPEKLSELRRPGIADTAIRHAESNGRVVSGTIELGPRSMRYYDKKKKVVITANLNDPEYQGRLDTIEPQRVVKLSLTGSAASSLQGLIQ